MNTEAIQIGWYMQGGWQETEFCGGFEHSPFTLHRVTNILSDVTGKQMYVMVDDKDELIPIEGNNFYKSIPEKLKHGGLAAFFDGELMESMAALRLKYWAVGREHEYDNRIAARAMMAKALLEGIRKQLDGGQQ